MQCKQVDINLNLDLHYLGKWLNPIKLLNASKTELITFTHPKKK